MCNPVVNHLSPWARYGQMIFVWGTHPSTSKDGGDLFGMISSHHPSKDLIWLWSWQLLQAVAFLHKQQICHRDISLENILLSKGDIRLMDFGQAVRGSLVVELPF